MPYEYDLDEFKKKALADAAKAIGINVPVAEAVAKLMVESYLAGYKQAEEDFKTEGAL